MKRYGDRTVINDVSVSFEKRRGRRRLVGPLGRRQEHALRCPNGPEDFQGGEIKIAGETLHPAGTRSNKAALRASASASGMVFQQWNLRPPHGLGNIMRPRAR